MSLLLDTATTKTSSASMSYLTGLEPVASSSIGIKNPSATETGVTPLPSSSNFPHSLVTSSSIVSSGSSPTATDLTASLDVSGGN